MPKLSDTQAVLLSAAAQRTDGSVLPLPASLKPGGGTSKALVALVTRGYAEERETSDLDGVRRTEGDLRYGLFVTLAGLAAIGVEQNGAGEPESGVGELASQPAAPPAPKPASKTAQVLALLARPEGATLAELVEATGWLPHTTRAALTGLRKKGHSIERVKRGEATCYRVASAA